jgi:hypothetical protein
VTEEGLTNDAAKEAAACQQNLGMSAAPANAVESDTRMQDVPPTPVPSEANNARRAAKEPPRDVGVVSNPDF